MTLLQDILAFLEARLQEDENLNNHVNVCWEKNPEPAVRDYGVKIYLGKDTPKTYEFRKIGPIVTEIWSVNVDFIYNKSKTPKKAFAEDLGLSYWEGRLSSLLIHQKNGDKFTNSRWDFIGIDERADCVILRGVFICEIENIYF